MKIKRSDERESYMLPGREDLVAAQEKDVALKELKDSFESLPDADRDRLLESGEGFLSEIISSSEESKHNLSTYLEGRFTNGSTCKSAFRKN